MILVTGTSVTQAPFEVSTIEPKTFPSRDGATEYIKGRFQEILIEKKACTNDCIPSSWELGADVGEYKIYAEKTDALTYHLRSDTYHIVYRLDILSISSGEIKVHKGKGSGTLFWAYSSDAATQTGLRMALVSGYSVGRVSPGIELPKTYEQIISLVPEGDAVTPMIITYTMLRANGKYAIFTVQDGYLYLFTDEGFISLDRQISDFEDGSVCEPDKLYVFSPIYKDIPSTVDDTILMFKPKIKEGKENDFRLILQQSMLPGLNWRDKVSSMVELLNIPQGDVDNATYTLMRIVGKSKLIKGATLIFQQYPCPEPTAKTP